MAEKLTFNYDKEGDVLYIDTRQPYPEQHSREIDDETVIRMNPVTGDVENVEVLFYTKRLMAGETLQLPISAELRPQD